MHLLWLMALVELTSRVPVLSRQSGACCACVGMTLSAGAPCLRRRGSAMGLACRLGRGTGVVLQSMLPWLAGSAMGIHVLSDTS